MNRFNYYFLFFLLLIPALSLKSANLQLIRTIGDDRPDYSFYVVNAAIEVNQNSIYILDTGISSLNLYDWQGNFKKRSGTRGEGPGDLFYPIAINRFNQTLFLLDRGNYRITEFDQELKPITFYHINKQNIFFSCFFTLKNNTFIGNLNRLAPNRGKIGIIDKKGNLLHSFFNQYPIQPPIDMTKNPTTIETDLQQLRIWLETMPILAINPDRSKILVSFRKPNNPVLFFLMTTQGTPLGQFSYEIKDKKYQVSDFYLKSSGKDLMDLNKYPDEFHIPIINAMGFLNNYYVVFLNLQDYKKTELEKTRVFGLIFNLQGTLLNQFQADDSLRIFSISENGTVLASKPDEEVTKIYVYHLNI